MNLNHIEIHRDEMRFHIGNAEILKKNQTTKDRNSEWNNKKALYQKLIQGSFTQKNSFRRNVSLVEFKFGLSIYVP
ncbi:hypothetical protein [uncultured Flavobacterium sp.]|uniref:hypothetical protein n=1 Tax=uncultured Flavobacterium sp. TaxID=165435 RepID=UPI0025938078|nr:hypothetical protein [uncultured Flavobacterium sp.]